MAVIKVPKPPKSAFNKNRPASSLLQAQIEHLEAAAASYSDGTVEFSARMSGPVGKVARAAPKPRPRTEGQAAEYIAKLTRTLLAPPAPPGFSAGAAPVVAAPAPPARAKRQARKTTRPRKRALARRKIR